MSAANKGRLLQSNEAADGDKLISALKATRPDYGREAMWHKFLLDAYSGTGGFSGGLQLPESSFWGQAADMYSDTSLVPRDATLFGDVDTYLDQFPREDFEKFRRRVDVAHYPNYVSRVVDIKLSYLHRKDANEENAPDSLVDWRRDVDGMGTNWDELRKQIIDLRAAVLGWCPVLFDMPRAPVDAEGRPVEGLSRAQAAELGIRVRAIPLFPAHVLAWQYGDNGFDWVKLCLPRVSQPDPLREPREEWVYTMWFPDRWQSYTVAMVNGGREAITERSEGVNPFGKVPLVIARHAPVPDDSVRGIPMAAPESQEAKRLFNVLSELDEHVRQSVFAILQVPTEDPAGTTLTIGSGNALPVKPDSNREYKWVSPDAGVAATLLKLADTQIKEIYRLARQEYTRGESSGQARSGMSRAFEFETTNRSIADFAQQLSMFEERVARLLGPVLGYDEAAGQAFHSTAPSRFDVEEMARVIEDSLSAIGADLGITATTEIKKRLVRQMLPNLDDQTIETIDSELEEAAKNEEQVRAAEREGRMAMAQGAGDDEEEDGDEDEEEETGGKGED